MIVLFLSDFCSSSILSDNLGIGEARNKEVIIFGIELKDSSGMARKTNLQSNNESIAKNKLFYPAQYNTAKYSSPSKIKFK